MLSELVPANSDIASELHKIHHSPKLVALQEIMEECGIGVDASSSEGTITVGQHRVLIFAQHKVITYVLSYFLLYNMLFLVSNCGSLCRPYWILLKKTCFKLI